MKAFALTLTALLIAGVAQAQTTAKDELGRLNTNISNAEHNLKQYRDNLKQVDSNMGEVAKAKKKLETQSGKISSEIEAYQTELAKFEEAEQKLKLERQAEKDELVSEEKQIAEVQAMLQKLHNNKKIREENISNYDQTLNAINQEKNQWKEQLAKIKMAQKDAEKKLAEAKKQESTWAGKKQGYEGEISRWSKEVERQKDLHRTYSSLAEKN